MTATTPKPAIFSTAQHAQIQHAFAPFVYFEDKQLTFKEHPAKQYLAKILWSAVLIAFEQEWQHQPINVPNVTQPIHISLQDVLSIAARFDTYFECNDLFYAIEPQHFSIKLTPLCYQKLTTLVPLATPSEIQTISGHILTQLRERMAQSASTNIYWFDAIQVQPSIYPKTLNLKLGTLAPNLQYPNTGFTWSMFPD